MNTKGIKFLAVLAVLVMAFAAFAVITSDTKQIDATSVTTEAEFNAAVLESNFDVKLSNDIVISGPATAIVNDGTIDLNGYTITGKTDNAIWVKQGTVSIVGTGTLTNDYAESSSNIVVYVGSGSQDNVAKVTIGSNVSVTNTAGYGVVAAGKELADDFDQILDIYGSVTAKRFAVTGNGTSTNGSTKITIFKGAQVTSTDSPAIYHPQAGTLIVDGELIGTSGIEIKSGNVNVEIGSEAVITATGTKSHVENDSGSSTDGYAIAVVENSVYKGSPTFVMNAGTIYGDVALVADNVVEGAKKGSITISGGYIYGKVVTVPTNDYIVKDGEITEREESIGVHEPIGTITVTGGYIQEMDITSGATAKLEGGEFGTLSVSDDIEISADKAVTVDLELKTTGDSLICLKKADGSSTTTGATIALASGAVIDATVYSEVDNNNDPIPAYLNFQAGNGGVNIVSGSVEISGTLTAAEVNAKIQDAGGAAIVFKDLTITEGIVQVVGDVSVDGKLSVADDVKLSVSGDVTAANGSAIYNNGKVNIAGEIKTAAETDNYKYYYTDGAQLAVEETVVDPTSIGGVKVFAISVITVGTGTFTIVAGGSTITTTSPLDDAIEFYVPVTALSFTVTLADEFYGVYDDDMVFVFNPSLEHVYASRSGSTYTFDMDDVEELGDNLALGISFTETAKITVKDDDGTALDKTKITLSQDDVDLSTKVDGNVWTIAVGAPVTITNVDGTYVYDNTTDLEIVAKEFTVDTTGNYNLIATELVETKFTITPTGVEFTVTHEDGSTATPSAGVYTAYVGETITVTITGFTDGYKSPLTAYTYAGSNMTVITANVEYTFVAIALGGDASKPVVLTATEIPKVNLTLTLTNLTATIDGTAVTSGSAIAVTQEETHALVLTASEGYAIPTSITITGTGWSAEYVGFGAYTLTPGTGAGTSTIAASAATSYKIEPADGDYGKISIPTSTITTGGSVAVTVIPDAGYMIDEDNFYLSYDALGTDPIVGGDSFIVKSGAYWFEIPAIDATKVTDGTVYLYAEFTAKQWNIETDMPLDPELEEIVSIDVDETALTDAKVVFSLELNPDYEGIYVIGTINVSDSKGVSIAYTKVADDTYSIIMPASDITITVTAASLVSDLEIEEADYGTVTADVESPVETGKQVTLTITADEGYVLTHLYITVGGVTNDVASDVANGKYKFTIGGDTLVEPYFSEAYDITITGVKHGTLTASAYAAAEGQTITLTVTPATGYTLKGIVASTALIDLKSIGDGKWTFTMPSEDLTLSATFVTTETAVKVDKSYVQIMKGMDAYALVTSSTGGVTVSSNNDLLAVSYVDGLITMSASNNVTERTTATVTVSKDGYTSAYITVTLLATSFNIAGQLENDYTLVGNAYLSANLIIPQNITLTVSSGSTLDLNGKNILVYGTLNVATGGRVVNNLDDSLSISYIQILINDDYSYGAIVNEGNLGYDSEVCVSLPAAGQYVAIKNATGLKIDVLREYTTHYVYTLVVSGTIAKSGSTNGEVKLGYVTVSADTVISAGVEVDVNDITLADGVKLTVNGVLSGDFVTMRAGSSVEVLGDASGVILYSHVVAKEKFPAYVDNKLQNVDDTAVGTSGVENAGIRLSDVKGITVSVFNETYYSTTKKADYIYQQFTVSGTPALVANEASGIIEIGGNVYVKSGTDIVIPSTITVDTTTGVVFVEGSVTITKNKIVNYNGTMYQTYDSSNVEVYNYCTFDAAYEKIATATNKTITVYGDYTASGTYTIASGQTVNIASGALKIKGTMTVENGGVVTGTVKVDGTVVVKNGAACNDVIEYQVKMQDTTTRDITYTTAAIALKNAKSGETVKIVGTVGKLTKYASIAIPDGVNVEVDSGVIMYLAGLTIPENSTFTNKGVVAINADHDLEVAGKLINNGYVYLEEATVEEAAEGVKNAQMYVSGTVTNASTAYIQGDVNAAWYTKGSDVILTTLAKAVDALKDSAAAQTITIEGIVTEPADIKLAKGYIVVDDDADLTVSSLTLANGTAIYVYDEGSFTGTIKGVYGKDSDSAAFEVEDGANFIAAETYTASTKEYALEIGNNEEYDNAMLGSFDIVDGVVTIGTSIVFDNKDKTTDNTLAVNAGATALVPAGVTLTAGSYKVIYAAVSVNGNMIVNGTLNITGGLTVTGELTATKTDDAASKGTVIVGEYAEMDVTGAVYINTDRDYRGALNVYGVVVLGEASNLLGIGEPTLAGPIYLFDDACFKVYADSDVDDALIDWNFITEESEAVSTMFFVNEIGYMTVFADKNNDVEIAGIIAIEDWEFIGYDVTKLVDADSWKNLLDIVLTEDASVGDDAYTAIYAVVKTDVVTGTLSSMAGAQVFIDGINYSVGSSSEITLKMGAHTIRLEATAGYTVDSAKITFNGVNIPVTASGAVFTIDTDAEDFLLVVSGVTPIPEPEPVDPVVPEEKEWTITTILLCVLVVLIAIMAVIVALRLNRN